MVPVSPNFSSSATQKQGTPLEMIELIRFPQAIFGAELRSLACGLRERLSADQAMSILDAPCGSGETTAWLGRVPGTEVLGCDLDPEKIRQAKGTFQSRRIQFECKDAIELMRQRQRQFDLICVVNSLHCLPDPMAYLAAVGQAVKPNGALCVVVPDPRSSSYMNFQRRYPGRNTVDWRPEDVVQRLLSLGWVVGERRGLLWIGPYESRLVRRLLVKGGLIGHLLLSAWEKLRAFRSGRRPSYWLINATRA
jgi:SAM-dependent methyltransferase